MDIGISSATTELALKLTVDEVYAIQGCILGLQGLTASICKDYHVDNMELLKKLETITDEYVRRTYNGCEHSHAS